MGGRGINLFDDKRDGLFSVCNLGSQWSGVVDNHHHQHDGYYYPLGSLFASIGQMGMGFGGPNSSDSQGNNSGMRIPCTELYVRYVQSEGKVKIIGVPDEDEEVEEVVEGVINKRTKKGGGALKRLKIKVKNPSLRRLISGGFAGAVSRTAVAPLETIRTHLMVGSSGHSTGEVFHNIMNTDGWKGLFRGNLVNVIRVAPSKAIEVIITCCQLLIILNVFVSHYVVVE